MRHEIQIFSDRGVQLSTVVVEDSTTVASMQALCPAFFRTKRGKNERYTSHRGCLIVRHTNTYSDRIPRRETVVYLFLPEGMEGSKRADTFCVYSYIPCRSIRMGKAIIDGILADKQYMLRS